MENRYTYSDEFKSDAVAMRRDRNRGYGANREYSALAGAQVAPLTGK